MAMSFQYPAMAAAALAELRCPDFSGEPNNAVFDIFYGVFDGVSPKPEFMEWLRDEVSRLSDGAVIIEEAKNEEFRFRVKGPAAYLCLRRGEERQMFVFGPYSTPFVFDKGHAT